MQSARVHMIKNSQKLTLQLGAPDMTNRRFGGATATFNLTLDSLGCGVPCEPKGFDLLQHVAPDLLKMSCKLVDKCGVPLYPLNDEWGTKVVS